MLRKQNPMIAASKQARKEPIPQPVPILMTQPQAAKFCGLSMSGWHRLKSAGRLPAAVKVPGGSLPMYRRADLEKWVERLR